MLDELTSQGKKKIKMPELDLPESEEKDPMLNYQDYMKKVKGFVDFKNMTGDRDFRKNNYANEGRFEKAIEISDLNGKYESRIGYTFSRNDRNTDIPGTLRNLNIQKNGMDFDIFIDCKPDFVKKSLTSGMVDMSRFHNNREKPEKTY